MRKYLPTFAELVDRLSIVLLKTVFIPESADAYEAEQDLIMHDLDLLLQDTTVNSQIIHAMLVLMLTNRYIWENEHKARTGGNEQDKLLKLTHSINGVRTTAKNIIARELHEREDLKVDALAADLIDEFGNWNLFRRFGKIHGTR